MPNVTFALETYPLSLVDVTCDAYIENALTKMLKVTVSQRSIPTRYVM